MLECGDMQVLLPGPAMVRSMSMTSLTNPSTDVDPTCSIPSPTSPSAWRISAERAAVRPLPVVGNDGDRLRRGRPDDPWVLGRVGVAVSGDLLVGAHSWQSSGVRRVRPGLPPRAAIRIRLPTDMVVQLGCCHRCCRQLPASPRQRTLPCKKVARCRGRLPINAGDWRWSQGPCCPAAPVVDCCRASR